MFKINQPKLVSLRSLTSFFVFTGLLNLSTFSAFATNIINETDRLLLSSSSNYGSPLVSQSIPISHQDIEEEGSEKMTMTIALLGRRCVLVYFLSKLLKTF